MAPPSTARGCSPASRGGWSRSGRAQGANLARCPPGVVEVLAVEPEPHLRELAVTAAGRAAVPVVVVDGLAERIPADDGAFDAVVVTLVL